MVLFESKIKKALRLFKYSLFVLVGVVLGFSNFQKGTNKTVFDGLSTDPLIVHADVPAVFGDAGSAGSDGPSGSDSSGDAGAGGAGGSCCSSCSDDGSL